MNNYHLRNGNTDLFCCEPAPAIAPALSFPNSNCMQMQMQMQHYSNSSSCYADDQLLQNDHNLLLGSNHLHLQETNNNIYMESINSSEFFDDPDPCLFISLEHQQPFLFQTNYIPPPPPPPSNYYNPNPNINNDQLVLSLRSHSQSQNPSSHRADTDHDHIHNKSKYLQVLQLILSELTTYVLADTTPVHSKKAEMLGALDLEEEEAQAQAQAPCVTPTCLQDVDVDVDVSRAQLLRLLQLVDNQYNKCMDEIQNMNSKFNAVSGNLVAPFAHLTISSLYKQLRKRITKEMVSLQNQKNYSRKDADAAAAFESSFIKHWASQKDMQLKSRTESHIWRPQRGLPEKSVSVLKAWLFQNFLRPYPSDNDKDALAVKSGLTRSQVSNWFINARVRLWKPMIEEMYAEVNKMKQNEEGSSATGLFV